MALHGKVAAEVKVHQPIGHHLRGGGGSRWAGGGLAASNHHIASQAGCEFVGQRDGGLVRAQFAAQLQARPDQLRLELAGRHQPPVGTAGQAQLVQCHLQVNAGGLPR